MTIYEAHYGDLPSDMQPFYGVSYAVLQMEESDLISEGYYKSCAVQSLKGIFHKSQLGYPTDMTLVSFAGTNHEALPL